ncbi:hypothetical protein BGZ73_000635 [Actinomortierella ambigua]|nr:hypothetical protein BGZ73_000635 [Actinomortierella ambigua]
MKLFLPLLLAIISTTYSQNDLPPIGAEIPLSMLAIDTPLQIQTSLVSVDFRGGIKHRVEVNPEDPYNSVRLRTIGFRVTAEHPDGGTFTIEQNDIDIDAKSLLRRVQRFPPSYEVVYVLPFTMTIDMPDSDLLVLESKEPAILRSTLTQYPPRGNLFILQAPVELVLPDGPVTTIATLQKFPAKMGGL